jgi:hypothetical protein
MLPLTTIGRREAIEDQRTLAKRADLFTLDVVHFLFPRE